MARDMGFEHFEQRKEPPHRDKNFYGGIGLCCGILGLIGFAVVGIKMLDAYRIIQDEKVRAYIASQYRFK